MLVRQRIILNVLKQAEGDISRLKLTKLAFLFARTSGAPEAKTFYQFLPYKYGPFSFVLYHELGELARSGHVDLGQAGRVLLRDGAKVPDLVPRVQRDLRTIMAEFGPLSNASLVSAVYDAYPWFTVNAVEVSNRREARPVAQAGVFTVGYERLQVDGFLNLLLKSGIERIIDVRSNPVARRFGFHKSTLAALAQDVGIEYVHVPEVGVPPESRRHLESQADYGALFAHYEHEIVPAHEQAVVDIARLMRASPSVLVCLEENPSHCHRQVLARHVAERTGLRIHDLRMGEYGKWEPQPMF